MSAGAWVAIGIAIFICTVLLALFLWDFFQKKHTILRNYPIIGHLRYIVESFGIYFRQYLSANDREEMPFNREERRWVYEAAKGVDTTIGFGSTRDVSRPGTIIFVDAPFPVLNRESVKAKDITIGPQSRTPYTTNSIFNISAMSYGAISKNAVLALSYGAKKGGCWINTGEGGLTSYHLESGADVVVQIGTAKYGFKDDKGHLSDERLRWAAEYSQVKMFEVKLSQGAKPGKGGILPAAKVTPEIAKFRNEKPYKDSVSPNRFPEIGNVQELLDFIAHIREVTGKPTGFKTVLGDYNWLHDLFEEIWKRGKDSAPDFITLDGGEGGSGAAPEGLIDYVGLSIKESLPVLVDLLVEYGLKERIKVIASGKLIIAPEVVWALCVGADFVNSARGFAFALGCVQALQCHTNKCPTGITTHKARLTRGLVPSDKAERVARYVKHMHEGVGIICHACGVKEPRELKRKHARVLTAHNRSVPLDELYPDKKEKKRI